MNFIPHCFSAGNVSLKKKGQRYLKSQKKDEYQKKIDELTKLLGKKEIEIELLKKYLGSVS
jgi:hypothetical protein